MYYRSYRHPSFVIVLWIDASNEHESAAALGSIPDDLIPDILLRLPAPAILRSRVVCKLWRSLIDDADQAPLVPPPR